MKKIKVKNKEYYIQDNGVMVPVELVREAESKISQPSGVYDLCQDIANESQECVVVLTLDAKNQIINKYLVTKGLVNNSQVHPREIFRNAIKDNAVAIILVHNHPSGKTNPSIADEKTTARIYNAGKIIGINLLDHIIVATNSYTSIREQNPTLFTGDLK